MKDPGYILRTTLGVRECPTHKDWVPSLEKCRDFHLHDFVQLCFSDGKAREWMWVRITSVSGGGQEYVGQLDNDPRFMSVKAGEIVKFGPEHIFNYLTPEGKRFRDGLVPLH